MRREDTTSHTEADAAWYAAELGRAEDLSSPPFPGEHEEWDR